MERPSGSKAWRILLGIICGIVGAMGGAIAGFVAGVVGPDVIGWPRFQPAHGISGGAVFVLLVALIGAIAGAVCASIAGTEVIAGGEKTPDRPRARRIPSGIVYGTVGAIAGFITGWSAGVVGPQIIGWPRFRGSGFAFFVALSGAIVGAVGTSFAGRKFIAGGEKTPERSRAGRVRLVCGIVGAIAGFIAGWTAGLAGPPTIGWPHFGRGDVGMVSAPSFAFLVGLMGAIGGGVGASIIGKKMIAGRDKARDTEGAG